MTWSDYKLSGRKMIEGLIKSKSKMKRKINISKA